VHPDAEVILFRNDEGAAGVARELGIRHLPHAEINERGTNRAELWKCAANDQPDAFSFTREANRKRREGLRSVRRT
jgi:hypothetical protein